MEYFTFRHWKLLILTTAVLALTISACTTFKADDDMILFNDRPLYPGQKEMFGEEYRTKFSKLAVDDTTRLQTAWISKGEAPYTVLYFGGNGFRIGIQGHEKAAPYAGLGYNVLLFDYRGYGWSDGRSQMDRLKTDAITVYDSLVSRPGMDPENLILHGHSVGSLLAAHVARNRQPGALVLESSVTTMQEWWKEVTPWLVRLFVKFEVADALKNEGNSQRVKQMQLPTLFVAGAEDPITPPELTRRLYNQSVAPEAHKQLHIFEGADHNSVMEHAEFQVQLREFVERMK